MSLLWRTVASVVFVVGLGEASSHDSLVVSSPLQQRSLIGDPEEDAKEWMEQLQAFSETFGDGAKFFENLNKDDEKSSKAWSHSLALVGCIASLVEGFLGTSSSTYVKAIQKLQQQLDQAIAVIQTELENLVKDITADFLKVFLAPKVVTLQDAVSALTQFAQTDSNKEIWQAQMEPISDRVDAWNAVALCLTSELSSCPTDALDIILNGGVSWPRPAVLTQFATYHYSLLASSATAICTYESTSLKSNVTSTSGCTYIDLTRLQTVATVLAKSVTGMKTGFQASIGPDMLPSVIMAQVSQNPNNGFDGASAIANAAMNELNTFYVANNLGSFFGMTSFNVVVQNEGDTGGNWASYSFATGWLHKTAGYDVTYMFTDASSYTYDDADCRSGSVQDMATCLNQQHNGDCWVWQAGRRRYNTFSYSAGSNFYYTKYSDTDLRVVGPGTGATANKTFSFGWTAVDMSPAPEEMSGDVKSIESAALQGGGHNEAVKVAESRALVPHDVPHDPESILKDISNVFSTAGAIADFFGPVGEAVGIVLDIIGSICSLISGLLGLGQPDPVIQALRSLEKDIMGKLSAVSDTVQQAKSTAQLGGISNILNNAEVPLLDIVDAWNNLYPNGAKDGKVNQEAAQEFKNAIGGNIEKYRDSWNLLVDCLAASNVDCVLQGRSALEILLSDGQIYVRPRMLTFSLKYYFILIQKSSVAICAYAQLFLDDKECNFMPNLQSGFSSVANKMKAVTTSMKDDFWASVGADKLPPVAQYFTDMHANQDFDGAKAIATGVENELNYWYFGDGLDQYMGVTSSAVVVTNAEDTGGNWQASSYATGWLNKYQGYDIKYMLSNGSPYTYYDLDCRDGSVQDMATCLNNQHNGMDWVWQAGRRRYNTFSFVSHSGFYYHKFSDEDLRMVGPGTGPTTKEISSFGAVAVDTSPAPEETSYNETLPTIVI